MWKVITHYFGHEAKKDNKYATISEVLSFVRNH